LEIQARWIPHYDHPGLLEIAGSATLVSASQALAAIREEVEKVHNYGVTDQEVKRARETAVERLAAANAAPAQWVFRQVTGLYFGYPDDFASRYQQALASVTRADVERVVKEGLDWARLTIAVVGNTAELRRRTDAMVRLVTVLDPASAPAAADAPGAGVDADASAQAKSLLERARQASGGTEKFAAIRDFSQTSTTEFGARLGGGRGSVATRWIAPTHFREENSGLRGRFVVYTDGKNGWISDGRASGALLGAANQQAQGEFLRLYPRLLLADRIEGLSAAVVDGQTVEVRDGARVAWLVFDPASGLPSKILYEAAAVNGQLIAVEQDLQDFREVAGIKLPSRLQVVENGHAVAMTTFSDMKINQGLKAEDLARRP
jgi:hypothetical protein